MAHVERLKRDWERGLIRYRIDSDYDGESITVEPKELLALLTWLQEHEAEITNDVLSNMTQEAAHERTDTIANITTSVDDKDIDAWLERESEG